MQQFLFYLKLDSKQGTSVSESTETLVVVILVSLFGFLATLGITIYDQRNSELYNSLIHRAKYLEMAFDSSRAPGGLKEIDVGGQFRERPQKSRRLIFKVGHDLGLSLIYGSLLGAWFFPFVYSGARIFNFESRVSMIVAASIALIGMVLFISKLLRLDAKDRTLYNKAADRDGLEE